MGYRRIRNRVLALTGAALVAGLASLAWPEPPLPEPPVPLLRLSPDAGFSAELVVV